MAQPLELVLLEGMVLPDAGLLGVCGACAQDPDDPKAAGDLADTDSLGSVVAEADAAALPAPLEHVLLEETLPLDVKALWRLVMADAQFWREFLERRQARGVLVEGWAHVKAEPKRARSAGSCAVVVVC